MAYTLLGRDFTPTDVEPKVTGRARYAEDFRVDGMVFCRLFPSPVPNGWVTRIGGPVMGAAGSALPCAISDALHGHYFNRSLLVTDMIVNAAAEREQSHGPLQVSTA